MGYQNEIQATRGALLKAPQNKKCFIYIHSIHHIYMSDFKKAIPEHDFESFYDKKARQAWFASSRNDTKHLVFQSNDFPSAISGLEFDQLIYIYPVCLKCGSEYSYQDMTWNSRACQWELNQGIQLGQLSKESRQVFEKATELRNRLEPNKVIEPLKF